jgi:hypothetical protein
MEKHWNPCAKFLLHQYQKGEQDSESGYLQDSGNGLLLFL